MREIAETLAVVWPILLVLFAADVVVAVVVLAVMEVRHRRDLRCRPRLVDDAYVEDQFGQIASLYYVTAGVEPAGERKEPNS